MGQAMAEFAMVAPFFVMLLFGIIEGGRFVFYYEMLNSAAREGARYAIVHGSNSDCPSGPMPDGSASCDLTGENVKEAVRAAALSLATVGDFESLEVRWCPPSQPKDCDPQSHNARGESVTIRVAYRYMPVLPLLPSLVVASESTLVVNN